MNVYFGTTAAPNSSHKASVRRDCLKCEKTKIAIQKLRNVIEAGNMKVNELWAQITIGDVIELFKEVLDDDDQTYVRNITSVIFDIPGQPSVELTADELKKLVVGYDKNRSMPHTVLICKESKNEDHKNYLSNPV